MERGFSSETEASKQNSGMQQSRLTWRSNRNGVAVAYDVIFFFEGILFPGLKKVAMLCPVCLHLCVPYVTFFDPGVHPFTAVRRNATHDYSMILAAIARLGARVRIQKNRELRHKLRVRGINLKW